MTDLNIKGSIVAKSRVEVTDYNYIKKYFNVIFEKGDLKEFGIFQKGKIPRQLFNEYEITDAYIDELHDFNKMGYNIYVAPAPRVKVPKEGEKSGADNIKECRWFFADFDHHDPPWTDVPKKQFLDAIHFKIIETQTPLPSSIVFTKNGYHLYWKLDKPMQPDEWQPISDKLVYTLKADWRTRKAEKVLRIPGFKNVKEKPFVKCRWIERNDNTYSAEEISKHLQTVPEGYGKKKVSEQKEKFSKSRPTWIEEEIKRLDIVNKDEPWISTSGEVLVKAADPEHTDSYRTNINIYTGKWFDHGHFRHAERLTKSFEGGGAVKYFTLIRHKSFTLEFSNETKADLCERYGDKFVKWFNVAGNVFKRNENLYSKMYPAKTAAKILKKYFTVPEGKPEAGMIAFFYFDGQFYYGFNGTWIPAKGGYLNSLIWYELDNGWMKKKDDKPIPFPVTQQIVDNIIKAAIGIRDLRYIVVKNGSYSRDEAIGNIFWINKRPDQQPAEDLVVCQNKIVNYRTLETQDLTLNLFCMSPVNVNYIDTPDPPPRCKKFLNDNFENDKQIAEVLKRDAYLCMPKYLKDIPAFFIMKGKTRSGKGTNIEFLREILGRKNYEETSMMALGEKYGLEKLIGILVAFISDMEMSSVKGSDRGLMYERLKKMSSGIDWVDIRLVGGRWISIQLPTKIVFATPILPTFPKSVSEFIMRMQITEYKKQYSWDKIKCPNALDPDPNCLRDMIAEKDAYFSYYITRGLKMLLKDGFKTTKEAEINIEEVRDDSNPFEDFYNQCTKPNADCKILNDKLLKVCILWGKATGRLKKHERDELTFAKITKALRRDIAIITDKDKATHKSYLYNRELTEYAVDLLRKSITEY